MNEHDRELKDIERNDSPPASETKHDKHRPGENRDPLTGEPGSHPVGTGLGAAGAGVIGAAIGGLAGPLGAVAGAAIGGVVGGLAGHEVAERIDPTTEDQYWREHYHERPYVERERPYEDYREAYRFGWESRARGHERAWQDVENDLQRDWQQGPACPLNWDKARPAARDAWEHAGRHRQDRESRAHKVDAAQVDPNEITR